MSHEHPTPATKPPRPTPPSVPALRVRGTLAVASIAVMIAQIANALPGSLNGVFQQTFDTVGSQLTWITAAFMIPVVVFELTFGVLGDTFGHRKLVVGGSLLVLVGSAICAIAPQVEVMWLGSAINGLGAGAIFPASLALVAAVTHNPRDRARGIALWAGFLSAGAAISPLLGGVAAGLGSWRGAYWVVAALGVATLFLSLWLAVEYRSPQSRKLDPWGQVTFAAGLILVLFGLVQGPEEGWLSTNVVFASVAGILLLIAFVVIELRTESPLLELSLFRNRAFTVSSIVAVVGMFAFLGACFATSMWLGPVQHQNPVYLGLLFLLLQGPAFVLIPVISRLLAIVAARWLLTAGLVLMGSGALLASNLDVSNFSVVPFIAPTLLIGVGFALTLSPMTAIALNTVPRQLTGMASATTNLLRDLGFVLGPVLVGAIALSSAGNQLVGALQTASLPADEKGAALGIALGGGPIALNSIPEGAPGAAAHDLALQALGSGFSLAFLVCALAAFAAALLTLFGLRGVRDDRGSTVAYADEDPEAADSPGGHSGAKHPAALSGARDLREDRV